MKWETALDALASSPRMRILEVLREKGIRCEDPENCDLSERCCNVGELAEDLELSQPTISHHLRELRRAGFVECEKDGRTLYCSIREEKFRDLAEFLKSFYVEEDTTCT